MILSAIIKVILVTQVWSVRTNKHEDKNSTKLLESIRRQLTHDNHDYIDTTTFVGSIYITNLPHNQTDTRRHMEPDKDDEHKREDNIKQNEEKVRNVKIIEDNIKQKEDKVRNVKIIEDKEDNIKQKEDKVRNVKIIEDNIKQKEDKVRNVTIIEDKEDNIKQKEDKVRNVTIIEDKEDNIKQKEDKVRNVTITEDTKDNDITDENDHNALKRILLGQSKQSAKKKYMVFNNKKGEVSLVKLGRSFPMFRLPRDRAQYRESEVE